MLWIEIIFELVDSFKLQNIVYTALKHKCNGCILNLFNVYAPVIYEEKQVFLDTVNRFKEDNLHIKSIVAGDFNTILYNSEKRGGNLVRDPFRERMEDFISNWDILDIVPK